MTPSPITQSLQTPAARTASPGPAARVAQEFEAVLLEAVLQPLARAGGSLGGGRGVAGDIYGGWWVRELAAAVARGGGVGLAGSLEQQLIRHYGR